MSSADIQLFDYPYKCLEFKPEQRKQFTMKEQRKLMKVLNVLLINNVVMSLK